MTEATRAKLTAALDYVQSVRPENNPPPVYGPWAMHSKPPKSISDYHWATAVDKRTLKDITEKLCLVPARVFTFTRRWPACTRGG